MQVAIVVLLAAALAAFTYLYLERLGRRAIVPLLARAVAWSALGVLLLNVACPVKPAARRPLVLLDGSLSLAAAGGHWREARDSARRWGDARVFGDERSGEDTLPNRGRSLLAPALVGAAGADRPVVVVTDGEIEDVADIPADLLAGVGVRVFPRDSVDDVAITDVTGPARVTRGDSVALDVTIRAVHGLAPDSVTVAVDAGEASVARRVVRLRPAGGAGAVGRSATVRLGFATAGLAPGDHILHVALAEHRDAEPRTDVRLHLLTVVATPGVVLLAAPADWDSRFLYRALKDVTQLPVRGYARLAGTEWRALDDLAAVPEERVRAAARGADLLVVKGDPGPVAADSRARGRWLWPSGERGETPVPGDWYLTPESTSPLAAALTGFPVDSFPPALQLATIAPPPGHWVALVAQDARRGRQWPALIGREEGSVRRVTTLVDGLWRWAFRGGSSEQGYRALVAATATWLLAGGDTAQAQARPVRSVVENGRPMIFEWVGPRAPTPLLIALASAGEAVTDTLRFDGAGLARLWLQPGEYRYRLPGGTGGTFAVETYSREWLPKPVALANRQARPVVGGGTRPARERLWLFGLCVAGLCVEWLARRRLGLR